MTSSFGSVSFARPSTRLRRAPLAALVLAGLAFAAPSFADSKDELEGNATPVKSSPSTAPGSLETPDENPSVPSVATPAVSYTHLTLPTKA